MAASQITRKQKNEPNPLIAFSRAEGFPSMIPKTLLALTVALLVALVLSGLSHAETVNTTEELQQNQKMFAYLFSLQLQKAMYQLGVEEDKKFALHADCKSQYLVKASGAFVVKPIEFPEDKPHPTKGVWVSRYQLERCGDAKFYNAIFFANPNGEAPLPRAFYPGSTSASPILVQDALKSAAPIALTQVSPEHKDCKTAYIFDMRVTEPAHDVVEGEKTIKGVISETWTFSVCGELIDVAMTFWPKPSGGGTSFMCKPMK